MPIKLGELLLKENMVSPQQLQLALDHQKSKGGTLQAAVVSLGFVKEEEIVQLLSRQFRVPSVDLHTFQVEPAVIRIIPVESARKYQVLPLSVHAKLLRLAMVDPTNVFAMDDMKFMTGYNVEPFVVSEAAMDEAIERHYGTPGTPGTGGEGASWGGAALIEAMREPPLTPEDLAAMGGLSEIDADALAQGGDAASITRFTNVLLVDSLKRGASDIHIEPYRKELRVRFRINGMLYNVMALPMKLRDPLTSHIKGMAKLIVAEKDRPQRGRITQQLRRENRTRDLHMRVCVRPTLWGETIIMQAVATGDSLDLRNLGLESESLRRFMSAIVRPYGVLLVTGSPQSGKTHTLYSALALLNKPDVHIMTAEDPIEADLPGINQVQIDELSGESFATVLRSFGLLHADVIGIGEIRDKETAEMAVTLAHKGRLVLAILDAVADPTGAVARLINMGIEPWQIATAVTLILSQRLVRCICTKCKTDVTASVQPQTLIDIGFTSEQVGTFPIYKGAGCEACNGTGYKMRVGLFEGMEVSEGIKDLILSDVATMAEIRKRALEEGMITLRMSGLEKIKQGITTIEEVLRETVA